MAGDPNATEVHHPFFARMYMRMTAGGGAQEEEEHRARMLDGIAGTVIEVGAGHGLNFRHYPETVERVLAVEPEPVLREAATKAATGANVPIEVVAGVADSLPAEDESFDAAVSSLVLCTVPDQEPALAELRRVIRLGGELRFYEHVVSRNRFKSGMQRFGDRTFWPLVAGGCHAARDTGPAIERAGFEIESHERFPYSPSPILPSMPHILGRARRS
jgi:ubiquinone/menaquinone biosynthesis C-methylase UbiE